MKNCKYRFLLFFVGVLFCNIIHATTFAERHQYKNLFEMGTFKQIEHSCIDIKKIIKRYQKLGNRQQEAEYTALLSECLMAMGQYKEAMSQAQYAKGVYKQLLNSSEKKNNLLLLYNYALVNYIISQLASALAYDITELSSIYGETLSIFMEYGQIVKKITDKKILEEHFSRISNFFFSVLKCSVMISLLQHNYAEAAETGEKLLSELSKAFPNQAASRFEYLNAQILLSNIYALAENYEHSLLYINKVRETVEKFYGKNNLYYALALYRIGSIYYTLFNIPEACKYLILSNDIFEKTDFTHHAAYAELLEILGHICLSTREYNKAKDYYKSARVVIQETCGTDSYHYYLNQYLLANYNYAIGNFSKAASDIKELLHNDIFLRETGDNHVVGAYSSFFETAYRSDNFIDIINNTPHINEYIQENRQSVGPFAASKLYIAIGRAYRYNHHYLQACTYFHKALEYLREMTRQNFAFLPEEQRIKYLLRDESRTESIFLQNHFAADDASGSLAKLLYDSALFQKGLLLNTSVNMVRIIEEKGSEDLKRDMRRLQLMMQSNLKTEEEKQSCRQLEQHVQQEARKYGDFLNFTDFSWQDIKKYLSSHDIAIEFVCSKLNKEIVVSAEVLSNRWKVPQHVFLFSYSPRYQKSTNDLTRLCQDAIRKKIVPLLKSGDYVYFAPAGELFMLPIEYLKLPNGKRMDEVYHMYRVSSTRELITMKSRKQPQKNIALFGGLNYNSSVDDMEMQAMITKEQSETTSRGSNSQQWQYLSHSMDEVQTISNIMSDAKYKISLFTQDEGVEEQFKSLSETHTGIIHIATHGFYEMSNGNDMEHAGLILTGANNFWNSRSETKLDIDDGILTAAEISNLNLIGTDLVVLSACQTGLGKVTGEGVFGLQRAFKKAGVQSILMSLWKVDDEATKVLMTAFYQYLKAGDTKREALRKAQALVRQKKFSYNGQLVSGSDIHFWGAFVLID